MRHELVSAFVIVYVRRIADERGIVRCVRARDGIRFRNPNLVIVHICCAIKENKTKKRDERKGMKERKGEERKETKRKDTVFVMVVQMRIVQVVNVVFVRDGRVPAACAVYVRMVPLVHYILLS